MTRLFSTVWRAPWKPAALPAGLRGGRHAARRRQRPRRRRRHPRERAGRPRHHPDRLWQHRHRRDRGETRRDRLSLEARRRRRHPRRADAERQATRAAPPENPMSADRVRWEHIQRVYEMCDRNVSETARRLNMHRRTLQRILAKRAPRSAANSRCEKRDISKSRPVSKSPSSLAWLRTIASTGRTARVFAHLALRSAGTRPIPFRSPETTSQPCLNRLFHRARLW
jgi:hypothetical protein